jgi:hypothetical protein
MIDIPAPDRMPTGMRYSDPMDAIILERMIGTLFDGDADLFSAAVGISAVNTSKYLSGKKEVPGPLRVLLRILAENEHLAKSLLAIQGSCPACGYLPWGQSPVWNDEFMCGKCGTTWAEATAVRSTENDEK